MNSRLLEPKSSALPTGLHPDIQFYIVANADFTQKENQCQEKTVEKRFSTVVVKTVVRLRLHRGAYGYSVVGVVIVPWKTEKCKLQLVKNRMP